MNPVNGHTQKDRPSASGPPSVTVAPAVLQVPAERVKELVAALEVPFDPSQIEWRVMNTTKNLQPARGQVVPYADQRAYTDRLNALFTPAGWTRKYTIHTSANFERSKDQKIAAKVLVTCELTIFGLGSHSATGEEWADDDNAATSAEAQSFKRACSCFGLGRYLYYFTGTWVDLDDRKRPKSIPQLTGWATPTGWLEGLRPTCAREQKPSERTIVGNGGNGQHNGGGASTHRDGVLHEIEHMEQVVGKRMVSRVIEERGEGVESQRHSGLRRSRNWSRSRNLRRRPRWVNSLRPGSHSRFRREGSVGCTAHGSPMQGRVAWSVLA